MNKNPFSLYDFLGYVFPGILFILVVYFIFVIHNIGNEEFICSFLKLDFWKSKVFPELVYFFKWNNSVIIILLSYIIGHFISFLSSITIEKLALWSYGYPSEFLLNKPNRYRYFKHKYISYDKGDKKKAFIQIVLKYIVKILLFFLLLPISVCSVLFGQIFGLKYLVIKEINPHQKKILKARLLDFNNNQLKSLIEDSNVKHAELTQLIYHYFYERKEAHQRKFDNYVALYGFLRSITLIFNIASLYLISLTIINFFNGTHLSLLLIITFLSVCITYLFYLDYLKFYRRYTEEAFMCLMTD